ncbi:hypothetical protein CYMTET_31751, partial [Cymbomonas tetramitiformis]
EADHPLDHPLTLQAEGGSLHGLNIGFIYCQNCAVDGRGQWVLQETVDRIEGYLDLENINDVYSPYEALNITRPPYRLKGAKNVLWDQHNLNDVVESSAVGKKLNRRSHGIGIQDDHMRNQWTRRFFPRDEAWRVDPATPAWMTQKSSAHTPVKWHELKLPQHAADESVVGAPTWLVGGWAGVQGPRSTQGVSGWWNVRAPPFAHFVGCPDKAAGFKSLGWWDFKAEAVLASTQHQDARRLSDASETVRPVEKRQYLALKGPKFQYNSLSDFNEKYFGALAKLAVLAVLTGRRAVAPGHVPREPDTFLWGAAAGHRDLDQSNVSCPWMQGMPMLCPRKRDME